MCDKWGGGGEDGGHLCWTLLSASSRRILPPESISLILLQMPSPKPLSGRSYSFRGGGESRGGQIGKRKGAGDDSRVTTRVTHTFTQKGELKLAKYLGE